MRAEVREDHKIYVQEGDNVTYTIDSSKDEFWKVANSHSYKAPNGTATINVVDSLYTAHTGSIYEHTGCSNLDGVINIGFETSLTVSKTKFINNNIDYNGLGSGAFINGRTNNEQKSVAYINNSLISENTLSNFVNVGFINNYKTTIDSTEFSKNELSTGGSVYGSIASSNYLNILNSTFSNNKIISNANESNFFNYGLVSGAQELNIESSTFINNKFINSYGVQGGIAVASNGTSAGFSASNSKFIGNSSEGMSYCARGGVFYANGRNIDSTNNVYDGNSVMSDSKAHGGAINARGNAVVTSTNDTFKNNSAVKFGLGGALYVENATININSTEDISNIGNFSTNSSNVKDDSLGGFAYVGESGNLNFNVSSNAKITIGNGINGYDSIASAGLGNSTITKIGSGELVVNSSMEYFTDTLNVNGGTMTVKNKLGASVINVESGATLGLAIDGNNTLSNSSLTLKNNGTIALFAKAGLGTGDYNVSAANITTYGNTKLYGGTLSGNVFKVSEGKSMDIDSAGEPVSVADNGRVILAKDGANTIEMAFNSDSATVNAVNTTTDTLTGQLGSDFNKVAAYSFDVTMADTDSVVFSFYIGDSTLSDFDFTIWHKAAGEGEWSEADDVSGISYDGEYLSFVVSHFSDYGYTAVPEPSIYAAIIGAISLCFAFSRRRK